MNELNYRHESQTQYWIAFAIIFCAVAVLFAQPLTSFNHIINPPSDLINFHFFARFFTIKSWRDFGELPLWNPLIFCGIPFIAAAPMSRFFPLNWLFFFIPVHYCLTLFLFVHFIIGGFGMFVYLKSKRLSMGATIFGATAFIYSFKLTAHVHAGHFDIICPFMYTPWLFFSLDRFFSRRTYLSMVFVAIILSLSYFIGHIQILYYQGLISVMYLIYTLLTSEKNRFAIASGFCVITLMTILITAITLLPTIQYASLAARAGTISYKFAGSYSMTWKHIITAFMNPFSAFGMPYFWEYAFYFGYIPLILCLVSLKRKQISHNIFFVIVIVFALFFSLGVNSPLFKILFFAIPGIGFFRCPARMWLFGVFAVAVLSATGLDLLIEKPRRKIVIGVSAVALVIFFIFLGIDVCGYKTGISKRLLLSMLIIGFTWVAFYRGVIGSTLFTLVILLFTAYDLGSLAIPLIRSKPIGEYTIPNSAYTVICDDPDIFRIYDTTATVLQYENAIYGFHNIQGDQPLTIASYCDFITPLANKGINDFSVLSDTIRQNRAKLSFLNVKYIFTEFELDEPFLNMESSYIWKRGDCELRTIYLYRNKEVVPRAFIIPENYSGNLTASDPELDTFISGAVFDSTNVVIDKYEPNTISFRVDTATPSILATSEIHYPGWQADIDGKPTSIRPIYGIFRSVSVPSGSHTVTFRYQSGLYKIGRGISIISVFIFGAGIWFFNNKSKQR
ncbi:MAG: YfhO family protein [Candidatus Auribacterota bacterium]|jgi:hypothetical protein|nr:YfhO family protein [Candidatus Auribacterota bacterium]